LHSFPTRRSSDLKADFTLSDDFSLMVGVMNDTDLTEFNPSGDYAFGAQLGFYGQFLNVLVDPAFTEFDFTGGFDVTDSFFLGLNGAYLTYDAPNDPGFYGVALYPQVSLTDTFTLGLRAEYFSEFEGGSGIIGAYDASGDASVFATTLTGSFTIDNLTIKPELRLDSASENGAFYNNDLAPSKSLSSFVLAAIYSF